MIAPYPINGDLLKDEPTTVTLLFVIASLPIEKFLLLQKVYK